MTGPLQSLKSDVRLFLISGVCVCVCVSWKDVRTPFFVSNLVSRSVKGQKRTATGSLNLTEAGYWPCVYSNPNTPHTCTNMDSLKDDGGSGAPGCLSRGSEIDIYSYKTSSEPEKSSVQADKVTSIASRFQQTSQRVA